MKFSLVLGTIGRTTQLERFLRSLEAQEGVAFELLVVDQNKDDRLVALLAEARRRIPIHHIRAERAGLSRARNEGLRRMTGDVVAFPDDDCWYPPGLLARVQEWFDAHPAHQGVSGRCVDESGRGGLIAGATHPCELEGFGVWSHAVSITVFFKREVVETVGEFDETLGVGAGTEWGSGEESDYVLRALAAGFRVACEPSIEVGHPAVAVEHGKASWHRAFSYGAGMGRVLRKHRAPPWQRAYVLFRAAGGLVLGLSRLRPAEARFHWNSLRGRVRGLFLGPAP